MGRKAGLQTNELYSALAGRKATGRDVEKKADGNGFTADVDSAGRAVFVQNQDRNKS